MVTLELFQVFAVLDFYVGVSVEGMILLGCIDEVCMHLCIKSKYACNIHVRHTNFHLYNIYTISTPPHVYLVLLLELTVVRVISCSSIICVYAVLCAVVESQNIKITLALPQTVK